MRCTPPRCASPAPAANVFLGLRIPPGRGGRLPDRRYDRSTDSWSPPSQYFPQQHPEQFGQLPQRSQLDLRWGELPKVILRLGRVIWKHPGVLSIQYNEDAGPIFHLHTGDAKACLQSPRAGPVLAGKHLVREQIRVWVQERFKLSDNIVGLVDTQP